MDQFCLQQGNHDRFFTEYSGYVLKWHKQHHIMSLEKPLRPGPARMQKMKYTDKLKKKKKVGERIPAFTQAQGSGQ